MKPRVLFLAGPYRAATIRGIVNNIRAAEAYALKLWEAGAVVISPHMNTALFDGSLDDSVWLKGAQELVRRSDGLVLFGAYGTSKGTQDEIQVATDNQIPIFGVDTPQLTLFIQGGKANCPECFREWSSRRANPEYWKNFPTEPELCSGCKKELESHAE